MRRKSKHTSALQMQVDDYARRHQATPAHPDQLRREIAEQAAAAGELYRQAMRRRRPKVPA